MPPEMFRWSDPMDRFEEEQRFYLRERIEPFSATKKPKGLFSVVGSGEMFVIELAKLIPVSLQRVEVVSYDYLQGNYERFHVYQPVSMRYRSLSRWIAKSPENSVQDAQNAPSVVCCLAYPCQSIHNSTD